MRNAILLLFVALIATVVAARVAFTLTTSSDNGSMSQPWAQDRMEFVAWNGERWTAWIRDGGFELTPRNPGKWSRHANSTLAFLDWQGVPWQAKIEGDTFILAHRGVWKGATESASALQYRDWQGAKQLRTVAQLRR